MVTDPQNPRHSLDGPRARLLALSQERGVSLAALSELLGRNPSYLQQFIRKGSPRKLEEQDRATLARFLGVGEEELREAKDISYVRTPKRRDSGEWVDVPRLDLGASAGPGR
ncbi:MAG: putative transcriptional regulator, partial [Porphyrobacter sp. HL-46]